MTPQMTPGEITKGNGVADHEVFDEQSNGKIILTVLSMTNQSFQDGVLASVAFTLDADLSEDTIAASLSLNETMLVTKAEIPKRLSQFKKLTICF